MWDMKVRCVRFVLMEEGEREDQMHPLCKSDWILKNEERVMVRSPGDTPGSGLIVSEGADATGVGRGSGMGRENCLRAEQVGRTGPAQKEPWWPPSSEWEESPVD